MRGAAASQWTCGLERLNPDSRQVIGGKAIGLARLIEAGQSVPYGFCVTVEAFEHVRDEVIVGLESLAQLQRALVEATLPKRLSLELEQRIQQHPGAKWAVRSSAVEEDERLSSFAGQQLTLLDVSAGELEQAIKRVWASLYEVDALLYRERMGVKAPLPSGIAVLVQLMVEPTCAGVLFTQSPLSDDPHEAIISAAAGLGVAVVDGAGQQDTYYIDRRTGYIKGMDLADERTRQPILSDSQLKELAAAAKALHERFESPQDIEWAFDVHGSLRLLQLRPVTTPSHARAQKPRLTVWSNANVGEALPGVGSPLTWSIIRGFSQRGFERAFGALGLKVPEDNRLVDSFRGRVYLNLTEFMSIASAIPLMSAQMLFSVAGGGGLETVEQTYSKQDSTSFLLKLPVTIPRVLTSQLVMPLAAPLWERYFRSQCDAFFTRELERLHPGQLFEVLDQVDRLFEQNGLIMLSCSSNFLMSFVVLHELLKRFGGERALEQEQVLVSALGVKSAEPGLDLLQLGRLARRSMRLRELITQSPPDQIMERLRQHAHEEPVAQFLDALEAFRRAHGHRAPREAELATARWREDVTFIFEVVRGFIESVHLPTIHEMTTARQGQLEEARQQVKRLLWPGVRPLFEPTLELTRGNARRREALRALVVDSLDMYRKLYKECGKRMVLSAHLEREDDIFFLTAQEIRAWFEDVGVAHDYRLRVLVRRAIYEAHKQQPDPPQTFVLKDKQIIAEEDFLAQSAPAHQASHDDPQVIFGLPGASGKASGIARVMSDMTQGSAPRAGEILVVPFADVGWTPLFLNASAVVMSLGGPLSHACIVAREYGIPTVVNARHATTLIRSGDRITVDGDKGMVYILERAAQPDDAELASASSLPSAR